MRLTPRSVRARATLAACAVVAVALTVASLAMLSLLRANLRGNAEQSARVQAVAVAKLAADGRLTKLVPLGRGTDFVQVVDAEGRVVAVSQNVVGRPALALVPPALPEADAFGQLGIEVHQQVTSVVVDTPKGQVVVHAGVSLGAADDAESTTALILAVGCPLLLLTVALVTWRVTGRALRPVEAIRSEVAAIGEQELHRRVPIPRGDDEITRLATTMNGMLDRLDLAGRRQRQFIADASHELRSPIAVLRTQLEVALGHPDAAVRAELVEGALQDAERLQALAADLLFLARLDAGSADRPTDPTDLTELVRATVRRRGSTLCDVVFDEVEGEGEVVGEGEVEGEVIVPGNRLWLTRLVTNLVDNAERHARRTVRIRVRRDEVTGEGVLEVFNDGPAVDPADRERIFERFTRLDDARSRDDGGTGLGLPIARDIAQHHGGTLAVVDSVQGATFQVRLPLTQACGSPQVADLG
ncbi:signal transduction histidine kinase [Streptacidiphilus sp. MAP12-20]|uniref:HAMP domain-containing sensor histidine kinase n=1 Tax=Streptacidiphilus sp. MAP12-20 TaxID=3156299 RepID=UPI003515D047